MDHAEAMDRMAEAVAGAGGLTALVAAESPEAVALREHVRGCDPCSAEWRAWSVMSLGLAAAAPDDMRLRPGARDAILGAVMAHRPDPAAPGLTFPAGGSAVAPGPTIEPASGAPEATASPTVRPAIVPGGRSSRMGGMSSAASRAARRDPTGGSGATWFRWLALGAAAAVLIFVAGAAFGRPLGLGGGGAEPSRYGETRRALVVAAGILQGQGYNLAQLQTPEGAPGGFVAVSPGSGDLVVVSEALAPPPEGARYACLVVRDGEAKQVGYMRFDGSLAFWAGPVTDPVDVGLSGDVFQVQLDTPGSAPALTGTF